MPDVHFYHSEVLPTADPDSLFTMLETAAEFLHTTVGNGWERVYYTGEEQNGAFTPEVITNYDLDWDPLSQAYDEGNGGGVVSTPWDGTSDRASTVYLRWSDGQGTEPNRNTYDYYMAILEPAGGTGSDRAIIRHGVLVEKFDKVTNIGSWPFVPSYNPFTGWGPPPADAMEVGGESSLYPSWPTEGSHDLPPPPDQTKMVWGYRGQLGYQGPSSEIITNYPEFGSDPTMTIHYFGGVENGAPYLYITIESSTFSAVTNITDKYYCHFGIGNIIKHGDWKGGQFSCGSYNHPVYIADIGSDRHGRMFDSQSTYYTDTGARSVVYYTPNNDPFVSYKNSEFAGDTHPVYHRFGLRTTQSAQRAWGGALGGICAGMVQNSGTNTMTGRAVLNPNHVRITDPLDDQVWYFLAGMAPAMRVLNMQYINPGVSVTQDGKTWKIFPVRSKLHTGTVPRSGFYGYAFRIS